MTNYTPLEKYIKVKNYILKYYRKKQMKPRHGFVYQIGDVKLMYKLTNNIFEEEINDELYFNGVELKINTKGGMNIFRKHPKKILRLSEDDFDIHNWFGQISKILKAIK